MFCFLWYCRPWKSGQPLSTVGNNFVAFCMKYFQIGKSCNATRSTVLLKCFAHTNYKINFLRCSMYKHFQRILKTETGKVNAGRQRKWQPSVTDGCLICPFTFFSILSTVMWTAAAETAFLFTYAMFIMPIISKGLKKNINWEISCRCCRGLRRHPYPQIQLPWNWCCVWSLQSVFAKCIHWYVKFV